MIVVTMEDKILIKKANRIWGKNFFDQLVCHFRNKYLLNKIDQTKNAVDGKFIL